MNTESQRTIQQRVIEETFKNEEFSKAVAQAVGDNLVKAIRGIDDWNLSYEIQNLIKESIFTESFKSEIKIYAESYLKENAEDIKKLVKDNMSKVIINGITSGAEKIGELMIKKITDIKNIY